jgi:3-oxoacyl-[acyl-carrier protein] reductase
MRIDNRTALVVGGCGTLGSVVADLLESKGARVVVADCSNGNNQQPFVHMDVADSESVAQAMKKVTALLDGRIDILVNAAGITSESPIVTMLDEVWEGALEVNLTGVMRTCRAVLPGMIERKWGRIINVSSQLGIKGAVDMAHYAAAKAGVIGFTKSLALEAAPHNVLANTIAPGPFFTPMLAGLSEAWKTRKMAELPLKRFGHAFEVAPTVLLLSHDPGGNLYVGQTLGPNSGDVMP